MRLHLDTDFGGDPDDACALVMLLGRPDVEIIAITTVLDSGGERAGCVRTVLDLCGRSDIPVTAGAATPLRSTKRYESTAQDRRYWPEGVAPAPAHDGAAADAIADSVRSGAAIVAIGPYTNLALADDAYPGTLEAAHVVVMGGWIVPPPPGYPQWGPERDFNVQTDVDAALRLVERAGSLTLSTLPETMPAQLTEQQLAAIAGGTLGDLLASQSRLHAHDSGKPELRERWPAIAPEFVNFHWDPVACAVAVGSGAVETADARVDAVVEHGVLRFAPSARGRGITALVSVDGDRFAEDWVAAVRVADR